MIFRLRLLNRLQSVKQISDQWSEFIWIMVIVSVIAFLLTTFANLSDYHYSADAASVSHQQQQHIHFSPINSPTASSSKRELVPLIYFVLQG